MRIWSYFLCLALVGVLACSDDDGGGGGGGSSTSDGVFIDSPVSGMNYSSGDESGTTNSSGQFSYPRNASEIEFSVGDIVIGSGPPSPVMTPLSLVPGAFGVTDNQVTNMARLLQTLDDDADTDNGISITQGVRDAAAGLSVNFAQDPTSFGSDSNVQSVVQTLTEETTAGERTLVDAATAQNHLTNTLMASYAGSYSGAYCMLVYDGGEIPQTVDAGDWTMEVDSDGNVSMNFDGDPSFSGTGTISSDGTFLITSSGETASASGQIVGGEIQFGSWNASESFGIFDEDSDCRSSD